jgi:hypothetical protein
MRVLALHHHRRPRVRSHHCACHHLNDKDVAVFVGVITEVFPSGVADYESRWERIFHERLSEQYPMLVGRYREFILQLWPTLFSPEERDRINSLSSVNYSFRAATIISPDRVASANDVTELVIVVGGRLEELHDVLRSQLVRLDAVR